MAKFPNQRTILIRSSSGKTGVERPYGIITRKELTTAFRVLDDRRNATPIMLFFALASNQNSYSYDFSPAALEREYGIASDRWRKAFAVLVKKRYLVKTGNNQFEFNSYPKEYRNVTFIQNVLDKESDKSKKIMSTIPADKDIPSDESITNDVAPEGLSPPTGKDTPVDEGSIIPSTSQDTPVEGESNNKDNKFIINYNNMFSCPDGELIDNRSVMESERDSLLDNIFSSFGFWDNVNFDILAAKSKAERHSSNERDILAAHVKELKKLSKKLNDARQYGLHKARNDYRQAINSTLPNGRDIQTDIDRIRIRMILDAYEQKYKDAHRGKGWPWTWGVWIDGWNDELQEPNFIVSLGLMPMSEIKRHHHNLDGIPREYYKSLRKSKDG